MTAIEAAPVSRVHQHHCDCGNLVFFRNSLCLACRSPLGFDEKSGQIVTVKEGHVRCDNLLTPAACNWLVDADSGRRLCTCCSLNRTIPDLTDPNNGPLWRQAELAKRRLVASLQALGLAVRSKLTDDPEYGLMFDIIGSVPGGPPVMTGHENGLITLNLAEADDTWREQVRVQMHEPYRTILGHLRHEVGHYYWDRLVAGTGLHPKFRELFGDEQMDYAQALRCNYEQGPPPGWEARYVSSYASCHPWEDWAETWTHYMHVTDTLDTATGMGIEPGFAESQFALFNEEDLYDPAHPNGPQFLSILNRWTQLTAALNELTRSMGQPDFYPYALPRSAAKKLHFIHTAIGART